MADVRTENELLFDLVNGLHGVGLTEEQTEAMKARVDEIVAAGEAIRAVPLDNADEPFIVFAPLDTRNEG